MLKIRPEVMNIKEWVIETRRRIHQHPELGFQEVKTAALAAGILKSLGLAVKTGVGRTGVTGLWQSGRPGACLAFRADMDALPLQEDTDNEWTSTIPGAMHACGHDMHTAAVLGLAKVITDNTFNQNLTGSIKFIIQPGEEGYGGGLAMIEDGVLEDPPVDAIIANHVIPTLKTGQLGFTPGVAMASVDNFYIELKGRGGHAAHPHLALDPIAPAAELIGRIKKAAQTLENFLAAVCTFNAGTKTNIIPEKATLTGTIRTLTPQSRNNAPEMIDKIAADLARETGLGINIEWEMGYPMLRNDPQMLEFFLNTAKKSLSPEDIIEIPPEYGAEDFSYYLEKIPGLMFRTGCTPQKSNQITMLHSPQFNPDEDSLPITIEIMLQMAEEYLKPKK